MQVRTRTQIVAALVLSALAGPAGAVDVGDGKLSINGNGGWAYLRTNENLYHADDDGDFQTSRFDLALAARPADRLVVSAALGFTATDVALEWAFAEWRVSDALRLRIGQVKHPLGNYMELQWVGTARPFFDLATSVYGPADVGATSTYGVALTGEVPLADWSLQYDAYAGAIDLATFEPYQVLEPGFDPATEVGRESLLVENIAGGRLSLVTPAGLVLRASLYGGRVQQEEGEGSPSLVVGGLSAFYRGEQLWLSVEGFGIREGGEEQTLAAYAELAWFLTDSVQAAARYELSRVTLEEFDGSSPLLRHDEAALGLNYWFTPDLVAKASFHRVEGKRFVAPAEGATSATGTTYLAVAGAQFTF